MANDAKGVPEYPRPTIGSGSLTKEPKRKRSASRLCLQGACTMRESASLPRNLTQACSLVKVPEDGRRTRPFIGRRRPRPIE
eukprot:1431749-Alexandrium_andersonii.AAC.1